MGKRSCGRVLGHGLSCQPGYQCADCAYIEELQAELKVASAFAIETCINRLEGYDRDGYDLWWRVPSMFGIETAYLIAKDILVGDDKGRVAWKFRLEEEEPELGQ